ncbi:unnamed protein product [Rotaria socialis]|uniref:Uncharacterized protein n=2 Tax=Rotaria socialis TaxID=392032 RepID=A0A818MJP7_9BILA|nr:unnamed protein product [Rotaria socialis]
MILLLVLLVSVFKLVYTLQCIDRCTMMFSMNQSFILPSNCTYIQNDRCSVNLLFRYECGHYIVTFPGDLTYDENLGDTKHFIMIETARDAFFSYDINHVCKETDDCARHFAEKKILDMTQRAFNISNLYSDLKQILHKKKNFDQDLLCFDANESIRQCLVSGMIGSCEIIDDLVKYKIHRRSCEYRIQESASVNIYESGNFAMMTIKCNRMLCNGPVTIEAVKRVLNHYDITDINGRLLGNSSHLSFKYYDCILTLIIVFWID